VKRRMLLSVALAVCWTLLLSADFARAVEAANESTANAAPIQPSVENSLGMRFVQLDGGEFVLGRPDVDQDFDIPKGGGPRSVRISGPLLLGVHEVRQRDFEAVMGTNPSWHASRERILAAYDVQLGIYRQSHPLVRPGLAGMLPFGEQVRKLRDELAAECDPGEFPVENVTWDDANEFCRRLSERAEEHAAGRSYRLPTEAEWEYACRAGSDAPRPHDRQRPDSDASGENAKLYLGSSFPLAPVGSYPANPWGLRDMRGNVAEWCSDWYYPGSYAAGPAVNPEGPESGYLKVVRCADWCFTGEGCKIARSPSEPWRRNPFIGFRVVCIALDSNTR
jgi:formylglycine-generating enzyme required for sulfatase activity